MEAESANANLMVIKVRELEWHAIFVALASQPAMVPDRVGCA